MNIEKSKTIAIKDVLSKMDFLPIQIKGKDLWYKSVFALNERTPSFKVTNNRWYCFSSGFGGYAVDLILKMNNCSVSEALNFLESNSFSFQKQISEPDEEQEKSYQITKITNVQHLALVQYLKSRGITNFKNVGNLKEIHYSIKEKKYFALGFRNNSGGFELRSKYCKICIGSKDISHIKNESRTLRIFEGFFDYLSFIQEQKISNNSDYLILNSVALLNKNLSLLKDYEALESYLDQDSAGDTGTKLVIENFNNATDCRAIFKGFKDYNEWFSVCELEVR